MALAEKKSCNAEKKSCNARLIISGKARNIRIKLLLLLLLLLLKKTEAKSGRGWR